MSPEEARQVLDIVELERLAECPALTVAVGAWICPCENAFHVSNAHRPTVVVECLRCQQGAIVFPWGS